MPNSEEKEPHVIDNPNPVTADQVVLVAAQLGEAWRTLGLRLNFSDETLEGIEIATSYCKNQDHVRVATHMLSAWSKLPSASVGRLALVLWEMGLHRIASQLPTI